MDSTSCWGGARGVKTCHVTSFWGEGGGVTRFMYVHEEKNSIITTDPFHIYYKIYYIFRSHGMPLFFLANPCQKIWLSKCHVTRWQKKKKKVNLLAMCSWVCYVIGGGNVSFLNLIPIAGTSGGKKKQESEISTFFFPLGGATNHACNIR